MLCDDRINVLFTKMNILVNLLQQKDLYMKISIYYSY